MKKITNLFKTLLVAAVLGMGSNAWGQVTSYSNDYEDATPNVDWTSGNTGRYTVAVEGTTDHYLHVASVSGGDNGTTITCSATNGKVTAGTDFYMSFDLILEGCNSSGRSSCFYIYDKNNSSSSPILKIKQDNGGNYTGWTINDNTALVTGGKGTGNWYNYVLTRIGTKEYLTVTKKSNSTKVLDMVELTNLSTDGGLGKMTFETNRYYAGLYVDNVVVRALDAPAFTLSATEVTPVVDGSTTVNVTGINGIVSVSSDNASIATASYSDGAITINGVADGVAYITVTAVNDGAKTTQTITATVGSVATTSVTVNYLCSGSPIASSSTIDDVAIGSTLTLSDITYSETIEGVGCRYVNPTFSVDFPYTVVENGVINITYTQQNAVPSLKVYANVNSSNYLIKTYNLDSKYVGDVVTVTYPEYYLLEGTLYSTTSNAHGDGYYKWNHTLTGEDIVVTYGNTAATNVVYYSEAEGISGASANTANNTDIRCSDATGATFASQTDIVSLPAGIYSINTQVWGNTGVTFTFKAGDKTISEHATTGALNPKSATFLLTETTTITASAAGANGKVLDLIYIVKTGECYESMSIVGDFSANEWDATGGIAMTRNPENPYVWTVTVEDFEAGAETYEFKAVADEKWDVYVLPDGDNMTFEFGTSDYPVGNYNLTFTVNTSTHTLTLTAEKDFTYTVAGTESFFGTNWDATDTTNDMVYNEESGLFEWSKEDVELTAGDILFKVAANHNWTVAYPVSNYDLNIPADGVYDVTITFNPATNAVAANAVMHHTYTVVGCYNNDETPSFFGTAWAATLEDNDMTDNGDGTYSKTFNNVTLEVGTIWYKVVEDHAWTNNWGFNPSVNGGNADYYVGTAGTYHITFTFNPNADGYKVSCSLIPATVSKTITSAGWATYCSPYALDFTNAIANLDAAYIVTGGADGVLEMTEVKGIVPANTGLLLKGEGDVAFPVASSDANVDVSANKLEGVTANTVIAAEAGYVLMNDATNGLGFYLNSKAFTVGANTAYLPAGFDVTSARFFLLDGGKTTSISEQFLDEPSGKAERTVNSEKLVYDLQGRRVNSSLKPGLYIMSGKKVVIK